MRIGKVVETGNREPPVVELNLTMPCPVTGNDRCTALTCRQEGCALQRAGHRVRESA